MCNIAGEQGGTDEETRSRLADGVDGQRGRLCGKNKVRKPHPQVALSKRYVALAVNFCRTFLCRRAKREMEPLSLGYLGNVVDLW